MPITMVGSWTSVAADRPFRTWLRTAPGSVGVHLADGRFVVRRAEPGAPEIATLTLADGAIVALDPRGELVAVATGSRLELLAMSGATLKSAELARGLVVKDVEIRADGERLWVFGTLDATFQAHAFDRDLTPAGAYALELPQGPYPTTINVHPHEDAFVVTTNEDGRDQEATIHRMGLRAEGGVLRVAFDQDEIDHPCVGFTRDGSAIVGVDAYSGVRLFAWPDYEFVAGAAPPDGFESRFDGAIVGDHVLTERHPADTTDSSLLVLAVPSLDEEGQIDWSARGEFGTPEDDAGNDLGPSLGADRFLEVTRDADAWTLRIWRLDA